MLPELPPRWASWAEANARHGEGQAQGGNHVDENDSAALWMDVEWSNS